MPNWKKVITSGSDAHLNQITASGNISASEGLQLGGGTFSAGGNTVTDAGIVLPEGQKIYTFFTLIFKNDC